MEKPQFSQLSSLHLEEPPQMLSEANADLSTDFSLLTLNVIGTNPLIRLSRLKMAPKLTPQSLAAVRFDRQQTQLYWKNLFSILIGIIRTHLRDCNKLDARKNRFLDIFFFSIASRELSRILKDYNPNYLHRNLDFVISEIKLISPHFEKEVFLQFNRQLFPSLVGNLETKFSEKAFRDSVNWISAIRLKYLSKNKNLDKKKDEKAQLMKELIKVARLAVQPANLRSMQVLLKEKKSEESVLRLEVECSKIENKAPPNYGWKSLTHESSSFAQYQQLVIQNDKLEKQIRDLRLIESRVLALDQKSVAKLRQVNMSLEYYLKTLKSSSKLKNQAQPLSSANRLPTRIVDDTFDFANDSQEISLSISEESILSLSYGDSFSQFDDSK